jgi:hypothetical protein
MGPYAVVDYNLLSRLHNRLQHIYHEQPYARVDVDPMPKSTLSSSQELRIWPQTTQQPVLYHIIIFHLFLHTESQINNLGFFFNVCH